MSNRIQACARTHRFRYTRTEEGLSDRGGNREPFSKQQMTFHFGIEGDKGSRTCVVSQTTTTTTTPSLCMAKPQTLWRGAKSEKRRRTTATTKASNKLTAKIKAKDMLVLIGQTYHRVNGSAAMRRGRTKMHMEDECGEGGSSNRHMKRDIMHEGSRDTSFTNSPLSLLSCSTQKGVHRKLCTCMEIGEVGCGSLATQQKTKARHLFHFDWI